jgi:hypothetical protein
MMKLAQTTHRFISIREKSEVEISHQGTFEKQTQEA